MVKAIMDEQPPPERKDTTKKKVAAKKKNVATGVWPCKINGCNKQFAREADLKRHQRTTKLHSMPGFSCPQCDATFTRTDALRRHQKSRHNGIVIEAMEQELLNEGPSRSSSIAPSIKGKEPLLATSHSAQGKSVVSGPATGHSSYYRQHTAHSSTYVPEYTQVGLPTSATRLNGATNWTQSHPWPEGVPPPAAIGYPIYYTPSPYYRQSGVPVPQHQHQPSAETDYRTGSSSRTQSPHQTAHSRLGTPQNDSNSSPSGPETPDADQQMSASHEPATVNPSDVDTLTEEEMKVLSMQLTHAAMEVVLNNAKYPRRESLHGGVNLEDINSRWSSPNQPESDLDHGEDAGMSPGDRTGSGLLSYGTPLDRPEPMEHMLTEDGEPMLNPAELLTQESLASPPPS